MQIKKPIVLSLFAALSGLSHAAWLTVAGEADNPASDYFQVNPNSVRPQHHLRFVGVRVNRSSPQVEKGVTYRSFDATAVIDCRRRTAHYAAARYFERANFEGTPEKVRRYAGAKPTVEPWPTADARQERLIKAMCAVDEVEKAIR